MTGTAEQTGQGRFTTQRQVSAGGVVFRRTGPRTRVVLIRVGQEGRWQLPKGLVDRGESPEKTALREVREEAGVESELLAPIDVIDYWYVGQARGQRVRFHKLVHFFLMAYRAGDVKDHDREVQEARWVDLEEAGGMLAFENEQHVLAKAHEMIARLDGGAGA